MNRDLEDLARLEQATTTRSARLISGALTPANVVLALLAYLSVKYTSNIVVAAGWWTIALILVVGVPYLILFRAIRTGSADDRQVVRRSQRPALMASAVAAVTIALVVLYLAGAPRPLVWLILAMICGLVAMALTTLAWKASMHIQPQGPRQRLRPSSGGPAGATDATASRSSSAELPLAQPSRRSFTGCCGSGFNRRKSKRRRHPLGQPRVSGAVVVQLLIPSAGSLA